MKNIKSLFFASCLFFCALVFSEEIVPDVSEIKAQMNVLTMPASCSECEVGKISVTTPLSIIRDLNSNELKFVARGKINGYPNNQACLFKTDKMYVLYYNCMANKSEISATSIKIIAANGDTHDFYIESFNIQKPISESVRSDYNGVWTISAYKGDAPGDLSANSNLVSLNAYLDKYFHYKGACIVGDGSINSATKNLTPGKCSKIMNTPENNSQWIPVAEEFWKSPPQEWYGVLKKMRTSIKNAKF